MFPVMFPCDHFNLFHGAYKEVLLCHGSNLELHPNFKVPLDTWCAKHSKAWLELESRVNSSVLHQLVPRLAWVLGGRDRVNIGHLASQAATNYVEIKAIFTFSYFEGLPFVFDPGYTTADDDIWAEALNFDLVLPGSSETIV